MEITMRLSRTTVTRTCVFGAALVLGITGLGCTATQLEDETGTSEAAQTEHRWKVLNVNYQVQSTGFWCGPAATRIALSTRMNPPTQASLANQLGTTSNGTDWIGQVTGVMNAHLGAGRYQTVEMPNDPPTAGQKGRLWQDIVMAIDGNAPIVANIVAPPNNHPPGYPNRTIYHYVTIIGYNPDTRQVFIADPANFGGHSFYWLSFEQVATLIPPKGYSRPAPQGTTCPGGSGMAVGAIDAKYRALGGCGSVLGVPKSEERGTPDNVGRYTVFDRGSIYWTPETGAHEVHGVIRDTWAAVGWEAGPLGYPITDETKTPDGVGRYNVFEHGSIYWTQETGAHEVHGVIRDRWALEQWETGPLGYPTSSEYEIAGGRRNDFQHGAIIWTAATNETSVVIAGETPDGASGPDGGTN
jgi:hypothetical protein